VRVERIDPNLALCASAVATVLLEAAHRQADSVAWLLAQGIVAGVALLVAWRNQARLRLWPVVALAVALPLGLLGVHLVLDVAGDKDSSVVFRWQGNGLLHGDYPRSEYPAGAVLLFGLEAWLGGGTTRVPNALMMAALNGVSVGALWLTRAALAPWLAAVVAIWPLNAFFWEYKFDLAPATLLALGLMLAWRERWGWSGALLSAGALVKWTPLLAAVALIVWLLASRRTRDALNHAAAFAAVAVCVYLPLLVWAPSEVLAAYERQSGRAITPESAWYLILRPLDLAQVRTHISFGAGAPDWANVAATLAQIGLVLALIAAAGRARSGRAALAFAALAPCAFLLSNRIFSPQFILVLFVGWAFAGALVARSTREQLAVGVAMCAASTANAFVYPFALPSYAVTWVLSSAVLFSVGFALTFWLARRAASATAATRRAAQPARAAT
jgi:hypothetical protein